jgi:hypothetical protein
VADLCEHSNEPLGSIKFMEFISFAVRTPLHGVGRLSSLCIFVG